MGPPTENDIAILLNIGEGQGLEFKRNVSSSVAREIVAFANAEGGRIVFGVDDRNHVVGVSDTNRAISEIQSTARNCDPSIPANICHVKYNGKILVVADIPSGEKKPYSCHDGYFLRVGATSQKMNRDELVVFVKKNNPIPFDSMICPAFTPDDFDQKAYRDFLDRSEINAADMDPLDVLRNLELLVDSDDAQPIFRNAAVLFFGKEPARFIRRAIVTCVLFAGTDKADILDRKDLDGNLAENVRQAMAFLKRHLSLRYEIKTLVRKEILELPEQALREAVLNAVCHRDYIQTGAVVMVEIYRDRVEIVSPGGLPCGLKQSELGKRSVHRNPIIADMFHRLGEVEKVGSGISRIIKEAREARVPEPKFHANGFFTVTFKKPKPPKTRGVKREPRRPRSVPSLSQVCPKTITEKILLKIMVKVTQPKAIIELMEITGEKNRTRFRSDVLRPLFKNGMIEMTLPEKPNSSKQRYVATEEGMLMLKNVRKIQKS